MPLTRNQVDKIIDEVLDRFQHQQEYVELQNMIHESVVSINSQEQEERQRIYVKMIDEKLIYPEKRYSEGGITEFGYQVLEKGGWLKHIQEIERFEQIERQTKELTLNQIKGNIFQIKYWWIFLLTSAIAGGLLSKLFDWLFSKL